MTLSFNTSISGLMAAQRGIKVAQMNVSNLNTVGYVRQTMELTENNSAGGAGIESKIGSGVLVENIKRITDMILQNNYNEQNSKVGYFEEIAMVLNEVETVMGDDETGKLSKLMGGFFAAWEEFSKFPEESAYRFALVGETVKLTQKVNEMANELGRIEKSVVENSEIQIKEINTLLDGLSEINKRINQSGQNVPNTLLNERDRIVNSLSSYMKIETSFENNHPEVISVRSGGTYLLDNETSYDIRLLKDSAGYYLSNGSTRVELSSGKLKANLDLVDKYIKGYSDSLNTFAVELMNQVNSIHKNGFSTNGDTGIDFFLGTGSKSIVINPLLQADPSKIASSIANGVSGNTDIAKNIANVINQTVSANMDFRNYVNSFSMGIAQDLNNAYAQTKIQSEVLSGLGERRASIEGVNLEEEMTNLMMMQKTFAANAKAIQTLGEVFDKILEI